MNGNGKQFYLLIDEVSPYLLHRFGKVIASIKGFDRFSLKIIAVSFVR